ncbi:A-kinase anchor protein 13 isoform X2 [Myripristis murdjan]|uniref:A-kinase anchor protein 13 isoform X2 n=1 Tax=Myripristis murdjan TaxID=586833 RepID=UPI001175CD0E|nr:A-kinase anchor protein 13-like isoform X2 [Myripristis murdjan]
MKLNPQQAPLYGECVLTVHLNDEEVCCAEGMEAEVEFYLLFSGSKQQHLTTTLRVSRVTLQAMCPAHDVCEQVLVTLCSARPDGMVVPHSQESFYYVQDLALDMARFLLDNTSLEALFLDDQQVSLKECERLDHSLVLALKHLSLLYKWTSVSLEPWTHIHTDPNITDIVINTQQKTHCNTHIGEEPDKKTVTQTDLATDTNTHTDIDRHNTEQKETHMRTWMDSSTPLESSIDLSQCQQQPTLLHLAASHGLKRVASFLLKQPGGREALRKTDAHGQTPVCLAKSKGHQHLLELFTQYETSLPDQVEPEDQLHIYPGGRVFQHHPSLGTYTLTLSTPQEREGRETEIIVSCCLQEEVKDLSALVQLHQENKGKSDLGGIFKSAPASPPLTSNHDLSSPPCRVWPCSNGQPESKEAADMAVATIENCGKAKQEQESPPSLEGRKQREGSTIFSHTSCTTGNFFHRQETGGEQEVTPAANWCVVRSRKSKKRTTKHRTKTLGKNKSTREAVEGTARTQTETTGSTLGTEEETLLLIEPTVAFASSEGESTKNPSSVGTQRTPLPIKPMHRSGCEGKSVGSRAVVLVTTTVEKQEGENWEIDLERSERDVGRNSLTETKQANIKCHPARQRHLKTTLDLASVSNITEHNVTMGQDQSKDPPDSESDQAELCQPDLRDQSPKLESKPRRVLWRDGGWIGAGIASASHGQEILPNTIWYQDENSDQSLNEGTRKDFHRKQPVSQTVWYTTDQPKNGQHEHKELTSPQASGLSTPQLFEQGLRFHQLSPALSQTHGTGIQPAPSHVAGAQRQEVHRSQQEEEVGEEWKEEGVDRDGKEVENREKSNYREISKRAETEETGEERQETEGRGEKGRRKRRKKRGKKGGMDAKLSSSSSIESQSQIEIQTQRKKVTEQNTQRETERPSDTQAEAKTQTGRADVYSPSVSELVWRKEASNSTMHLPRQTEGTSRNSHGLDHESTTANSCGNAQEPGQIDLGITEISQFPALQTLETMELSEDESMDIHGPNGDHTNPSCRSTAPEFGPVNLRKMENFELTALQQFGKEKLSDPELVESNFVKPVQPRTSMDHMESSQLLENKDITTAVQTVASVDLTGLVEFNCVKELPLTYSDSTESRKESEEQTAPVSLENKGTQLSQSLAEKGLVATTHFETCTATFPCEGHHSVSMDNEDGLFQGLAKEMDTQDTVTGWREKEARKNSEEANRDAAIAHDRSQMEPETLPAAAEQLQQTKSDTASTHYLEIQRDRETLCLLQPCPEDNTPVTACTALHPASHPDREECVSVCVLQRDTVVSDNVTASAELDDMVFKKLEEPVPRSEGRDREMNVSWSSTDDSSFQGPFSASSLPSQGALSVGMSNAVTGWKSRTHEGGGGGMEGGGEEEERQDQLTENPVSSAIFGASICSLSPFRRHSWESGRNNATGETDMINRSSLNSLSVEVKRTKPPLHRRSMSWCPSNLAHPNQEQIDNRSYSLEGLEVDKRAGQITCPSQGVSDQEERARGLLHPDSQERGGSLVSLTEEEQEGDTSSIDSQSPHQVLTMTTSCPSMFHHQTLTKSISMVAISQRETDGMSSFSSTAGSAEYSISEDKPGPLRSDTEGRGGTKVSRTFSYLRSKMSKKCKEKDKERRVEKERESKDREKKMADGHVFIPVSPSPSTTCQQCTKLLSTKEAFLCNNCGVHVHKNCKESLAVCTKAKMRQQSLMPEAVHGSAVNTRNKSTSSASSVSSSSSSSSREHWSMLTSPEDQLALVFPRRNPSILSFNTHSNLAKSISTSNIAGLDDVPLKGLKFLSQSTDSLHQGGKVSASIESLTDEGTELIDSQLMGEFECEVKDLEADSWSATVDKKFLKMLKKDEIKRQDVIYELYQTEFHHVRTLKIMSEVYYKGIQKELQLDSHTLDKVFPMLDVLLATHTQFFSRLLERRRASSAEGQSDKSFLIRSIGDVLVNQFSGCNAEQMKKVYGKFCSRHNEAVNLYKELHTKDKRFQAFIKRIMSNSIVRRLSIPECILLVTQRITKYPVLIQRILQHTKDTDEDHGSISDALCYVKELLTTVDSKVNEHEKKRRLREVYSRTDSKSIMRMKSGQMFAKEDLIRGRRLLHDGALQLKNSAGRLKDVHAMLLSDVLVFLQEKDQKYVFASLDQRSTVISLQKLIVREVANEERGLFLITAGIERPEMVEVLASTKDERNTWMAIIQDAMHCMEKDEDEGVPSETEEDRRQHENRVKEIRELLRKKDKQIISLLEEKVHIFRDLSDYNSIPDNTNPPIREHMLFRARTDDVTRGEPIMKGALREVETLQDLINRGLCGAGCSTPVCLTGGTIGPVCLPRRAETFGGFDSHQMNSSKNGEKEEGDESLDLRRTESDSVLKRGATTSLQMLLKRNNEQVLHSVTNLHDLLTSLKAVVVQQDSLIEDQRQALTERLTTNSSSSRHSSSSSLSSSSSSRPSSLIEQEKQRSLERQRQEAASLQKQQVAYQEERRRREKEWEIREKVLAEREERLREEEERAAKKHKELEDERELLVRRKEEYQRDLKRLSEEQRRLERDKEALRRDTERLEATRRVESGQLQRYQRTPSTTSEDSLRFHSSGSLDFEPREGAEQLKEMEVSSSAPTKEPFLRIGSKKMGKNFNPFSSSSSKNQGAEKECQLPTRLLQLAKPKEKKEKKKKRKGGEQTQTEGQVTVMSDPQNDGDIFFC